VSDAGFPKSILERLGLKPRKSLGQHFLIHAAVARRIALALEAGAGDPVVEIGGGLGALTFSLADLGCRVEVLEIDPALAAYLESELFPSHPRVRILRQDALTYDFAAAARQAGRPLFVVGNLPYQITSPLLFRLAAAKKALARAVLMLQAEVGRRLLASPGVKDYGILTVAAQYHFNMARLFSLGPGHFFPPPKVDSVVLSFTPIRPQPEAVDEELFLRVVKTAFGQRRKTLKNTLAAQAAPLGLTANQVLAALTALDIDPGRRGETLSVSQFVRLSNHLARLRTEG